MKEMNATYQLRFLTKRLKSMHTCLKINDVESVRMLKKNEFAPCSGSWGSNRIQVALPEKKGNRSGPHGFRVDDPFVVKWKKFLDADCADEILKNNSRKSWMF